VTNSKPWTKTDVGAVWYLLGMMTGVIVMGATGFLVAPKASVVPVESETTFTGYLWNVYEAPTFVRPYVHPDL